MLVIGLARAKVMVPPLASFTDEHAHAEPMPAPPFAANENFGRLLHCGMYFPSAVLHGSTGCADVCTASSSASVKPSRISPPGCCCSR